MWLTPENYCDFAKNCKIVYFQFDLTKLLDEIYNDVGVLPGITFDELNEKCMRDYDYLINSCPEDTPFEQYLDQELHARFVLLRQVLLEIHKCFLDD